MPEVVVVGSGVSGLSCAYLLARSGWTVEIRARAVPPATTSNVAAAFWFPYLAQPRDAVLSWSARSWHRFAALAEDPRTGVRMASALELLREPAVGRPWWADAVAEVAPAEPELVPPGYQAGWSFVAPIVDTRHYLPWLTHAVAELGVVTRIGAIHHLDEVAALAPVVVDCAGLGARELASDRQVQPIRGQIALVENPGLTRVLLDETHPDGIAYVVPRGDDVVLGGTSEPGVDDRDARRSDRDAILARCIALEPRLAGARILADVVGLRPGRPRVRLDTERRFDGGVVVNDYGHGGAGVTLSWGCAEDVVALVAEHLGPGLSRTG